MSGTGRLDGKVALVTGGSRGLGRGIAEGFAAEGAKVVVNYVEDEKAANAVVEAAKKSGSDAIAVQADIGEVEDVKRMIDTAVSKFGTIDILVNNAGMLNSFKLSEMSVETWDTMIKVHLRGAFHGGIAAELGHLCGLLVGRVERCPHRPRRNCIDPNPAVDQMR